MLDTSYNAEFQRGSQFQKLSSLIFCPYVLFHFLLKSINQSARKEKKKHIGHSYKHEHILAKTED